MPEQTITVEIPGPGARVDEHAVMAENVRLDLSALPEVVLRDFQGVPIGKVLEAWQEGDRIFMKARVNLENVRLPPGVEIEFHPGFMIGEIGA